MNETVNKKKSRPRSCLGSPVYKLPGHRPMYLQSATYILALDFYFSFLNFDLLLFADVLKHIKPKAPILVAHYFSVTEETSRIHFC